MTRLHLRVTPLALACVFLAQTARAQAADTGRVWEQGSWRGMGDVPAGAHILDHPLSLALGRNAIYVFNAGSATVVALGLDGRLLWRYSPPDSLRFGADRVVSLAAGFDGGVWVADPNSGRCTILSPLGNVERVVPMRDGRHFAPRSDGSFWQSRYLAIQPMLFDANGHRVRTLRLPASLAAPPNAVGDALLAVTADTLVVAYSMAGRFLIAPPHGAARDVRAIEPRAFATFAQSDVTVAGRAVHTFKTHANELPATLGLAVDSGVIYALYFNARGATGDPGRTVDMYRTASGRYVGSRRLPMSATHIAIRGDVTYALTGEGDLRIWRWVPSPTPPSHSGGPATVSRSL